MIYMNEKPAILIFKDGTYFEGIGFGAVKKVSGEVTFSAIPGSGYVETLTDPTYKDQIVLFTYPSIGNYGVPAKIKDGNGVSINLNLIKYNWEGLSLMNTVKSQVIMNAWEPWRIGL